MLLLLLQLGMAVLLRVLEHLLGLEVLEEQKRHEGQPHARGHTGKLERRRGLDANEADKRSIQCIGTRR